MSKNIGSTLREKRIESGITVKEISKQLCDKGYKASEKTIYSWENGNSHPNPDALLELCKAYGIQDILPAFGYDGYNEDGSIHLNIKEQELIEQYRNLDLFGQETVNIIIDRESARIKQIQDTAQSANIIDMHSRKNFDNRLIKYFRSVSAGSGIFILGNESSDWIEIPDTPENQKVDYATKVNGKSMEPSYNDGDVVLVSQNVEMHHGDIGIFIVNGKSFIKEYGKDELISINPDEDNISIHEYDSVVCMGKVVGKL